MASTVTLWSIEYFSKDELREQSYFATKKAAEDFLEGYSETSKKQFLEYGPPQIHPVTVTCTAEAICDFVMDLIFELEENYDYAKELKHYRKRKKARQKKKWKARLLKK